MQDSIYELSFFSNSLTPTSAQQAMEKLFSLGAVDVFFPAVYCGNTVLSVLSKISTRERILFYLSSLDSNGRIYEKKLERSVLNRSFSQIATKYGSIPCKESSGYGTSRGKLEYDDLSRIARKEGLSLPELKKRIRN